MILNEQVQEKWKPILEHEELPNIDDTYRKSVTAILLENQEKMMRQQAQTENGQGLFLSEAPMGSGIDAAGGNPSAPGSFQWVDPVLISLVRRTMPKLLAYDVCGVQPMTSPVGLIFAMRSQYGSPGDLANEGGLYDGTGGANSANKEAFYGEANELKHFRQVNTYGGHPVATAVSLKNIEIVERENLVANAAKMETYIKGRLNEFSDHPYVGEIRGKGLLLGIELVSDKEKKTPLEMAQANAILQNCLKQGVSLMRNGFTVPGLGNILIMAPPLILQESEADIIVDAIGNALKQALN